MSKSFAGSNFFNGRKGLYFVDELVGISFHIRAIVRILGTFFNVYVLNKYGIAQGVLGMNGVEIATNLKRPFCILTAL